MTVTQSDEKRPTTTTNSVEAAAGPAPMRARAREAGTPRAGAERDEDRLARVGSRIRSTARMAVTPPGEWLVWDRHPASTRVVAQRITGWETWNCDAALLRWAARAVGIFLLAWEVGTSLLKVWPRNKICWLVTIAALTVYWLA